MRDFRPGRSATRTLIIIAAVILALPACGDDDAATTTAPTTTQAATTTAPTTPPTTTTTTTTSTTTTTVPPIQAAPELIRIAPNTATGNLRLEVLEGDYQLTSGATLRAGSSLIDVPETFFRFYEGLRLDVAEEVTITGVTFPAGSELIYHGGSFVER